MALGNNIVLGFLLQDLKTIPSLHQLSRNYLGLQFPVVLSSLLSAQSQDLSSHSTGRPVASPQIMQGRSVHRLLGQTDKPVRVSSVEQYGSNGLYSYGMNSMEVDKIGSIIPLS
jgi:hypothetical protein